MSVVVYDGYELVGDRFVGAGPMMLSLSKVGKREHFFFGFVGAVGMAQYLLELCEEHWANPDRVKVLSDAMIDMNERAVNDNYAEVLIIPKNGGKMYHLATGTPLEEYDAQPTYMGAPDGQGLFNYCKALNPDRSFARECVGMCIAASAASTDPYAVGPCDVYTVNPFEAIGS